MTSADSLWFVAPHIFKWAFYLRHDFVQECTTPREYAVFTLLCAFMASPRIPKLNTAEGVIVETRVILRLLRRMRRWPNVGAMGRRSLLKTLLKLQARGYVRVTGIRRGRCLVKVLGYPKSRPVGLGAGGVSM